MITTILSLQHPSMVYNALITAGASTRRKRIRPTYTRRDSHGGRSDEFISRACIACRHYAIELITYNNPPTHQETRGIDTSSSFKVSRVHSTYKCYETGGNYVSREETTLRSIRDVAGATAPHRIQAPLVIKISSFIQVWCNMPWMVVSTLQLLVVADRDVTIMPARFM